jgi:hypothetical protein
MGNFYTDVISGTRGLSRSNRVSDPSLLEPSTRQLVMSIISPPHGMAIKLVIHENLSQPGSPAGTVQPGRHETSDGRSPPLWLSM